MNVGFVGLGIMGSRMAAQLQQHGHSLVVYNRTPEKANDLVANGAALAATPAEVAKHAEVVFTMLAHPDAVQQAALGDSGFLDHVPPGAVWVDCSTVHQSFSQEMGRAAQARGVRMLDAPVAGSKAQAAQAQLVFFVGGAAENLAAVRPLLDAMGRSVVHVGEQGQGVALKLVVNLLLATAMAGFAEGLALGEALGLSQETLFKVLVGGPVAAPFIASKHAMIAQNDYEAEFPLRWMQKDLQMVATAAYEHGVALPVANVTKEIYQLAVQQGLGEQDFAAVYRFLKPQE